MSERSAGEETIECVVYRASRRADTYLFVPAEADTEALPAGLRAVTGRLEKALELTLSRDRRLARAEASEVMRALREQGYYLQLPPPERTD